MTRDEKASAALPGHGVATLVGRDWELALVGAFLDQAAAEGGALLLTGDPGVGKTMLLDAAATTAGAAGTRVLRVAGAEFGGEANFSALSDLLRPVLDDRGHLSELNQRALNVTLGLGHGAPPERLVQANAVLALLRHVSAAGPVLLVADDLPWLDRPSAMVLGLVARRLTGTRIGFLGAARPEEEGFFERGRPGWPRGRAARAGGRRRPAPRPVPRTRSSGQAAAAGRGAGRSARAGRTARRAHRLPAGRAGGLARRLAAARTAAGAVRLAGERPSRPDPVAAPAVRAGRQR